MSDVLDVSSAVSLHCLILALAHLLSPHFLVDHSGEVFDDMSPWGPGWSLSSARRLILEENIDTNLGSPKSDRSFECERANPLE